MLFKEFGGVDAFPLCLDTKNVDEIVAFVKAAAPAFGGDIIVCNRRGALYAGAAGLDAARAALAQRTNSRRVRGSANEVLAGADVLIGVSGPGAVSGAVVGRMAADAIVFAMANPVPEVRPQEV